MSPPAKKNSDCGLRSPGKQSKSSKVSPTRISLIEANKNNRKRDIKATEKEKDKQSSFMKSEKINELNNLKSSPKRSPLELFKSPTFKKSNRVRKTQTQIKTL